MSIVRGCTEVESCECAQIQTLCSRFARIRGGSSSTVQTAFELAANVRNHGSFKADMRIFAGL